MRRGVTQRGAAVILVVVVIAALLAIAAPFVVSMRLHDKSAKGFATQVQAQQIAGGARDMAVATLAESHPDEERRVREAQGDLRGDPEGFDDLGELDAARNLPALSGLRPFETANPRGTMAVLEIADARGRIDLNASPPDPVANLLGVTVTTADLDYDEDAVLQVEDTSEFYSDNDPSTVDGVLKISTSPRRYEYIAYRHTTPQSFHGLERGYFFSRRPPPEEKENRDPVRPGALVQDARGDKVALDAVWRHLGTVRQGELASFDSTAAIRRIADWEFGTARAAMVLMAYGVTMSQLHQWRIDEDSVFGAGLDPYDFDADAPPPPDESREERLEREEAEEALKGWGIPLNVVKRFGGARALVRVHRNLMRLSASQRDKQIEVYRQQARQLQNSLSRLEGWLEEEVEQQLRSLTEMRDQAPFLETIGRIELEEKIRPYVTVDAPPEGAAWSDPLVVNQPLRLNPYDWVTRISVSDGRRFIAGTVVKVEPRDGRTPEFRYCVRVRGRGSRQDQVLLFPQLDYDYEAREVTISARQPRPLNINTASRKVLQAVLTGLMCRIGQISSGSRSPTLVTPSQAREIASAIEADPPASFLELRGLLRRLQTEKRIDLHAYQAVLRNAIDPGDPLLVRSTVPFTFRSGDVYELTATGIVNDPVGNELARHRVREVVRVAPPRELVWHVDSQADFTDRINVDGPLARGEQNLANLHQMFLPGRWANHLQSRPAYLGPFAASAWAFPERSHAPGTGDIQPLLGRDPDEQQGSNAAPTYPLNGGAQGGPSEGALRQEHWDGDLEGVDLAGLNQPAGQMPKRFYPRESRTEVEEALGPGLIRGWFRFDRLPAGRAYLFDGGEDLDLNRLSLYLEGGELVLSAKDEALDLQETGGTPRHAQVRYSPATPFQPGNWYHVAAFFKGSDRGDLALMVDGRLVGRQTHGSVLAQPLDRFSGQITLEDASGFPPSGWIRLGNTRGNLNAPPADRGIWGSGEDANARCEVLYYDRKLGNVLVVSAPPDSVIQQIVAGNWQYQAIDLDDGNAQLSSLNANARRPQRGSGHRVLIRYRDPNDPTNRVQQHQLGLGYTHEAGTHVVPYGYIARVRDGAPAPVGDGFVDRIRLGGATLAEPLLSWTPYTLLYDPVPGYNPRLPAFPHPVVLDDVTTQIPVLWAAPAGDPPAGPVRNDPQATTPVPNVIGGFPSRGVLRIGSELIYYNGIDPSGRYFLNCLRGFMGTTPTTHELFEPVVLESIRVTYPPGYAQAPDDCYAQRPDVINDGRVYVSIPHGLNQVEWLSVQPAPPGPIPSATGPTVDLVAQGLMLAPVREQLQPLQRHYLEWSLIQEMIQQNGDLGPAPGNLPMRDPSGQDPEANVFWKEILKRAEQFAFNSDARAQKSTVRPTSPANGPTHPVGAPLHATFILAGIDELEVEAGDVVTVNDAQTIDPAVGTQREELTIAHAALARTNQGDQADGELVAFSGPPARIYEGSQHARLARWPTGNVNYVPSLSYGREGSYPNPSPSAPGALTGKVDELVVMQLLDVPPGTRFGQPVQPIAGPQGTNSVSGLSGNPNQFQNGRLFLLDDEAVAVVNASGGNGNMTLSMLRGALGSTPREQSPESLPWLVPWPKIAVAAGGVGGRGGRAIGIRNGNGFRGFSDGGGYAALDPGGGGPWAGVFPYVERGNGFLRRPVDDLERGVYATAFGSSLTTPGADDLLIDLPFRAHDRYGDRINCREGVYFQAAREIPGGYVTRVEWDETLPSPYCEVKLAVRLDGGPEWDSQPTQTPRQRGQLYLFDDPSEANEIHLPADRVELRVYITFKPGALYSDAWKRGALVGAVRVYYRQPTTSLRREERVD